MAYAISSDITSVTAPSMGGVPLSPPTGPITAAEVLVEALEREGVNNVFAYPGGASVYIQYSLSGSKSIKTILPRHEQGGIFAAAGYSRASGKVGVCVATSGPGATNLFTGLADAMADSIPVVAITGQVSQELMGTNAFQELPVIDMVRHITKGRFFVRHPEDIPRIIKEAFSMAQRGRPGPILIDIPKDVLQEKIIPDWTIPVDQNPITDLHNEPQMDTIQSIVEMILEAKKPVLYVGGGCVNVSEELWRFVELTSIPITSTLMGLGVYPCDIEMSYLGMLGMYGTPVANYAVNHCDLLLAFGVRFDDRVTGEIDTFATHAKIVHIDIDARELGKNKTPLVSMNDDIKVVLQALNNILGEGEIKIDHKIDWKQELNKQSVDHHLMFKTFEEKQEIRPQYAIEILNDLTQGNAIITTGVGEHQMLVAQYYKFKSPRHFLTSGGMGTMGYGLPAAIGAAIAKPKSLVIDVDGDGSFMMSLQELATVRVENLPIKIMILNNQRLGMLVRPDDPPYEVDQDSYTYLGNATTGGVGLFPDMVKFAEACDIPAKRAWKKSELKEAMERMITTPGPYLLDVVTPFHENDVPTMIT